MAMESSAARAGHGQPARAALFDWDGTLVDSRDALLATWREVLGRVYPSTADEVATVLSRRGGDVFPTLSGSPEKVRRLEARFGERYPDHAAQGVRAFPGVAAALARLRSYGIGVGVVTSKARSRYEADSGALASLVDVAVCAEDVVSAKPDPEGVHRALATLGAGPGWAVLVGDTAVDIETAAAAGIPAVGVTWGSGSASALMQAGASKVVGGLDSLVGSVVHLLHLPEADPQERW